MDTGSYPEQARPAFAGGPVGRGSRDAPSSGFRAFSALALAQAVEIVLASAQAVQIGQALAFAHVIHVGDAWTRTGLTWAASRGSPG